MLCIHFPLTLLGIRVMDDPIMELGIRLVTFIIIWEESFHIQVQLLLWIKWNIWEHLKGIVDKLFVSESNMIISIIPSAENVASKSFGGKSGKREFWIKVDVFVIIYWSDPS